MSEMFDCADEEQRSAGIAAAVAAVLQGELVVLPTDTESKIASDIRTAPLGIRPPLSAFASTTIHCARCHHHKFDLISQKDYYRFFYNRAMRFPADWTRCKTSSGRS